MTAMADQQQSQLQVSKKREKRRRGRASRGLRGKAGPSKTSSGGSLTSFASEHSHTSQSTTNRRDSLERVQGSITLGNVANPPRRRTSSKVNLAALLEKESQHDGCCRMKAEPEGLTLSEHNISSHCSDLASKLRNQLSGSVHGITTAEPTGDLCGSVSTRAGSAPFCYSSGESCDSFRKEEEEEIEMLPFDASKFDADTEEEIEFDAAAFDAAEFDSEEEVEVPPIMEFEVPPSTGGRRSIRLSITNMGPDRGSRSIRVSVSGENPIEEVGNSSIRERFSVLADSAANLGESVKDDAQYEMEIYPGHFVPFRNANEIWRAVAKGRNHTMRCICLDCECELVSVIDCEHVLCPDCHMVNPIFEWPAGVTPNGAAMGLKQAWITQKQNSDVLAVAQLMTGAA